MAKYMIAAIAVLFLGCGKPQTPLIDRTQVHMATFVTLSLPQEKKQLFKPLFEKVRYLESIFSSYQPNAELAQLNRLQKLTDTSNELRQILKLSQKLYRVSYGYFDISIGSVTKGVYHFGELHTKIPSSAELQKALLSKEAFGIDKENVWLKKGYTLDLGGLAKGFSVDLLKEELLNKDVEHFKIAFSGDIYCHGSCTIAIASPFEKDTIYTKLSLQNAAISTSGNYERFIKNKQHNHLINPKTKVSQQSIASITLVSKHYSNVQLDAFATALAVMPKALRKQFLQKHASLNYLIIYNDKSVEERL